MTKSLIEALARTVQGEHRSANGMIYGTVTDVSPKGDKVRVQVGEDDDGSPVKGPWVPIGQWDGRMKIRTVPKVGQQVLMLSPGGDWEQGKALPFTWKDDSPAPSEQEDEDVFQKGSMRVTFKSDSVVIEVGGSKLTVSSGGVKAEVGGVTHDVTGDGVTMKGGKVTHDDLNVGSDHKHRDVTPGGGVTGIPV